MVQLLIGHKGSGKTKSMCDMANDTLNVANGSVVFLSKSDRLTYDLKHKIRIVCMADFKDITNTDEYIGFIYGILSSDHDLEYVFIDSLLKHADINPADLPEFFARLNNIEQNNGVKFVVSASLEKEEMEGVDFSACNIIEA